MSRACITGCGSSVSVCISAIFSCPTSITRGVESGPFFGLFPALTLTLRNARGGRKNPPRRSHCSKIDHHQMRVLQLGRASSTTCSKKNMRILFSGRPQAPCRLNSPEYSFEKKNPQMRIEPSAFESGFGSDSIPRNICLETYILFPPEP